MKLLVVIPIYFLRRSRIGSEWTIGLIYSEKNDEFLLFIFVLQAQQTFFRWPDINVV